MSSVSGRPMTRVGSVCSWLLAFFSASTVAAAGFAVNELGARPLGMGNAYTAIADTPSAVVFNPAGLVQQTGLAIEAGVAVVMPKYGYTLPADGGATRFDVNGETQLFTIPAIYAAYRVHRRVAVGLGFYSLYGLGVRWPDTVSVPGQGARAWPGRDLVQEVDLKTAYFAPSLAVRLHERLLLGAGVTIVQGAVYLRRAVTQSASADDDVSVELSGDDLSVGFNLGLLLKLVPRVIAVGLTFRSGYTAEYTGKGAFSKAGGIPDALRLRLSDGRVRAAVDIPHVFAFGVAVTPLSQLTLGLSVDLTMWNTYDSLSIEFLDSPALSSEERRDWHNAVALRFGAEYRWRSGLAARAGFIYDQSPAPDETVGPELPDGDRFDFTLGLGYQIGGFSADLAYLFLATGSLKTDPNAPLVGTRRVTAHVLGLSLGYRLPL